MLPTIAVFIEALDTSVISSERRQQLDTLANFIQKQKDAQLDVRLNFICTHNSRRSHLSQVWAQAMAGFYSVHNVFCYSGGTEETAVYPGVISTLKNVGFEIASLSQDMNPVYSIKCDLNSHPIIAFSKKMDDAFNPASDFAAVMTCTQADEGCPFVPGAAQRISLPFEDPKAFDRSPQEMEKYAERSAQIATELKYVFSKITTR